MNAFNLRHPRTLLVAVGAAVSLLAASCGGADSTSAAAGSGNSEGADNQIYFQLNWVPGGFNAGFALAKERGYYEDAGIFVTLIPGNGSASTAQLTAAGNAKIAYADAVPVSQLIAKGAPLKVIATLYQAPPVQVTALADSGIESLQDLKGKSVAVATGSSAAPLFPLFLEANDIEIDSVEVVGTPKEAIVPQLLQGNVDAILGSMDFFGIQLSDRGVETVDFPFYEYGVSTVSTSIFASTEYLKQSPDTARKFVAASLKGWADALEEPQAAIDALVALFPNVDPEQAIKELKATETLFCANDAKYIGKAGPAAWKQHKDVLSQVGTMPADVEPTSFYSYDFLPPESELTPCSGS